MGDNKVLEAIISNFSTVALWLLGGFMVYYLTKVVRADVFKGFENAVFILFILVIMFIIVLSWNQVKILLTLKKLT